MKTVFTLVAVAGLGLAVAGCSSKAGQSAPQASAAANPQATAGRVRVAVVQQQQLRQNIRAAGMLGTKEEVKLSFKIGGVIDKVYADDGQAVQQGQLLAALNLREIDSQVQQALQGYDKAERDYKRAKALYADSVVTLEQLQNATTGLEVAKSSLAIAQFNKQYATIYAPVNGRVVRKLASENELIGPGSPVFVISTPGKGWVLRVGLADRDAVRLGVGDAATVTFSAFTGTTFTAHVSEVAAAATPGTGTYEVELLVNPQGKNFVTGLVGKAEIAPGGTTAYKLVPVESLLEADGARGVVYVLGKDGGNVQRRAVQVAFINGGQVALSSGVEAGEKVVTDGAAYVNDNARVTVIQ
jgi:RND family efflux transporter MFP subunit